VALTSCSESGIALLCKAITFPCWQAFTAGDSGYPMGLYLCRQSKITTFIPQYNNHHPVRHFDDMSEFHLIGGIPEGNISLSVSPFKDRDKGLRIMRDRGEVQTSQRDSSGIESYCRRQAENYPFVCKKEAMVCAGWFGRCRESHFHLILERR